MSYQAITDIIVAQKTSDLQLSATVKDSPKQTSASFADFLASYKSDEVKSEDVKTSEPVKNQEIQSSKDVSKDESVSEEKVEKGNSSESDSKVSEKSSSAESKDDTKVSEADSDKSEHKNLKTELKKELADSEKTAKSEKDGNKELKDSKKLSKKDFARLDEVTKKDITVAEVIENAENLATVNHNSEDSKLSSKLKTEKDSDFDENELLINSDNSIVSQETAATNTDNKASDFEFDFSGKNQNEKKEFALDKDGKIKVEDLRTETAVEDAADKKNILRTSEIKLTGENTAVMSVELNPNAQADVLSLNTQTAAADGSNFQAMLTNQLHNVAPEFVKAGNLVLKDNNQGTINLVLHPDDLGNVKIHLSLDGKTLSGHITVATKEALQVFKDNSETLREAFIKNGFDSAEFDVAFNNGSQFNQNMNFGGQDDGTSLLAKHVYNSIGGGLDSELEDIFQNAEDISNYSVNIVA